jgi:hypothetical protein
MDIKHVCSLGNSCHTAYILKRNNIKVVSYPFDWIISNYKIIKHCIEDNFHIFLDKSYYMSIDDGTKCRHAYYEEDMFYHHNPLMNEKHYEYYVRCVQRFQDLLKNTDSKLFITMVTNITEMDETTLKDMKNHMLELNQTLSKNTTNYTLLVIFNMVNKENNYHMFSDCECVNIHFLELHTKTESDGIVFKNMDDNIYLRNIIRNRYNFDIEISS